MTIETLAQLFTIGGTILIVPQILIALISMVRNHKREKLKATIDYFEQIDNEIKKTRGELAKKYKDGIGADDIEKIYEDEELVRDINMVINAYERLALATNMGVLDYEAVKRLSGALIRKNYKRYRAYIEHRRINHSARSAWVEFELLADKLQKDVKRKSANN